MNQKNRAGAVGAYCIRPCSESQLIFGRLPYAFTIQTPKVFKIFGGFLRVQTKGLSGKLFNPGSSGFEWLRASEGSFVLLQ